MLNPRFNLSLLLSSFFINHSKEKEAEQLLRASEASVPSMHHLHGYSSDTVPPQHVIRTLIYIPYYYRCHRLRVFVSATGLVNEACKIES